MSTEAPSDGPTYEVWIGDTIHPWEKDTISLAEIRELGGLSADCPVAAVDLIAEKETPLAEDTVHEVPPRAPGKPLVKRTRFRQIS